MPFKSKAQAKKCYAMKRRGKAKGWDCDEWASKTNYKSLPKKKRKKRKKKSKGK